MELYAKYIKNISEVLILIIMEDTHGVTQYAFFLRNKCLNPYYNGRYSWRL